MEALIDSLAQENDFSGVVYVERGGEVELAKAFGLAHRAHEIPNTTDTQFAIASGTKGLTAVAVASLIEEGTLAFDTSARSVLGDDLPVIDVSVTVELLLAHRSGIGDYLDEDVDFDLAEYAMPVPVHKLATTEQYLKVLDGFPTKFAPDERFSYSNSGYVVLALIAERVSGTPFHELVVERVCRPAGMTDTAFLRSDELPAEAALGYVTIDGPRTNVFHLPVRGSGDGGIYTTARDVASFWRALVAGDIVSRELVTELVRARSDPAKGSRRYGRGFWLAPTGDVVMLEGSDTGVSFFSAHDPVSSVTHTVVSNTSDGAWPIARLFLEQLPG